MKTATFNINGVNERLPNILTWLAIAKPDVVCLQELKAAHEAFPIDAIGAAGYGAVWRGERSWNGVTILARDAEPILIRDALPGDPDDLQSRYIETAVNGVLIASLYLPNGNPQPGPKFTYKLDWFDRLIDHAGGLLHEDVPAVLAGDFNVVPTDFDIYSLRSFADNALVQPAPRAAMISRISFISSMSDIHDFSFYRWTTAVELPLEFDWNDGCALNLMTELPSERSESLNNDAS